MDELSAEIDTRLGRYTPKGPRTLLARGRDGLPHLVNIPNPAFTQPPRLFAETFGLAGVFTKYNLPPGVGAAKLEAYVLLLEHAELAGDMTGRARKDRLSEIWQGLVGRNPSLAQIKLDADNAQELQIALRGVAGGYVARDIDFFMSLPEDKLASACKDLAYKKLYDKICAQLGSNAPRWLPAMETMRAIDSQVSGRKLEAFQALRQEHD